MNIYDLTIDQTTPGEIIANGVVVTIEGIVVVFLILILIMFTIYAMSLFSGEKKSKKQATEAIEPIEDSIVEEAVDEGELIAVLTAAVAACMGTSCASVNIKSYKKVSSAWGNAGRREVLDNRF